MRVKLRLREIREARGLSQAALAKLAGVRQATISDLETGRSRSISFAVLDRLAVSLQVEAGQLLAGDSLDPQRRNSARVRRRRS